MRADELMIIILPMHEDGVGESSYTIDDARSGRKFLKRLSKIREP